MHEPGEKDPAPLKLTEAVGVDTVPESVSLTDAVHEDATPTVTDDGVHTTPVDVERLDTDSDQVLALEACARSP